MSDLTPATSTPETLTPETPAATTDVEYLEVSAVPTIVVRRTDYPLAEMGALMDSTFSALFPVLGERGITPVGAPFSLHTRIPSDTADLEVGIPVSAPLGEPVTVGDVELIDSELPAGPVAHITHVGSYDGLGEAWGTFMGTIAGSGRAPAFPFWEVYTTEPSPTADPATMHTDLWTGVTGP